MKPPNGAIKLVIGYRTSVVGNIRAKDLNFILI
jgi:hypothetical protein